MPIHFYFANVRKSTIDRVGRPLLPFCNTIDDVIAKLREQMDASGLTVFIAIYGDYGRTHAINGPIGKGIKGAKKLLFCFGERLPYPQALAIRPRSIGIADMGDHFFITFLKSPEVYAMADVLQWVKTLADKPAPPE